MNAVVRDVMTPTVITVEKDTPFEVIAAALRQHWNTDFDDASAIGRRYRRQDEIGTPYCVTVDFESLEDQAVTVRERDSMKQERIGIDALVGYLSEKLAGC